MSIANPINYANKLGEKPLSPEKKKVAREVAAIRKRVAKFEAQRAQADAQEDPMKLQMHDLSSTPPQKALTFTPKASQPKTNSPTIKLESLDGLVQPGASPAVGPNLSRVQRVSAQPEPAQAEPDAFDEMVAELEGGDEEPSAPQPQGDQTDDGVESILKRYKGSPEEVARQVAKSYRESEKRMRQMEQEKALLLKAQGSAPAQPQPQPQQHAPLVQQPMQQVQVKPQFDYKKWGQSLLDEPDVRAKELEAHIAGGVKQEFMQMLAPVYDELVNAKLMLEHGDVVTKENLDIIKALAHNTPGNSWWEKTVGAVNHYKTVMAPKAQPLENPEVQQMQQSVSSVTPQARTSGERKKYKESDLQALIQEKMKTGEYRRNPKWRNLMQTAYAEGRVIRGQ